MCRIENETLEWLGSTVKTVGLASVGAAAS
jgi:hypothetical protein